MGCMSSTQPLAPLPAGLQAATREYFSLGEVPLTLKASARGSVLEVKAAGLDRDDLLTTLESGFYSRGYWISEATVHVDRGFFSATFELRDKEFESERDETEILVATSKKCNCVDVIELDAPLAPLSDSPSKRSVSDEQFAEGFSQLRVPSVRTPASPKHIVVEPHEIRQLEAADRHAIKRGAAVRLTLMRDWSPSLRLALEKMIRSAGMRMIMARFSMARHTSTPIVKDTLWLSYSLQGAAVDTSSLPEWLMAIGETLQSTHPRANKIGIPAPPAPADVELQVKQMAMTQHEHRLSLPSALQEKAGKLHYTVEPAPWGVHIGDLEKFCGSGISINHAGKHVLEFATYFLRVKSPVESAGTWPLSFVSMVSPHKGDGVAEFVTQYSPPFNTLTVQKVFLNGVLPPGQRSGARLVAEQLLHMPVKGDPKWDGLEAVRSLRRIHLFDVVNWNTYALMSWASEAPSRIKRTEAEKWLLREEAKAVGLTLADVNSKPISHIFARTALGKLVQGILQVWRESEAADKIVESVTVRFSSQHELILGEFRSMMEIDVELAEGSDFVPEVD